MTPPLTPAEVAALVAELHRWADSTDAPCAKAAAALLAEKRRADEAERDAARYRWLRDVSVPPHNFYISVPVEFHGVRYTSAEVDAAIDAALAAAGKEPHE